jgi:hypothetical protein
VIHVTVTNEGEQQEDNVSVKVYVDSAQVGSTKYVSLDPGARDTRTFLWIPSVAKNYSVEGEVGVVSGETDTGDNTKTIEVRVSAMPKQVTTPMPTQTPPQSTHTDETTNDKNDADVSKGPTRDGWEAGTIPCSDICPAPDDDIYTIHVPHSEGDVDISVRDDFLVGDRYEVLVDGVLVGTTPAVTCGGSVYSEGTFKVKLTQGDHTLQFKNTCEPCFTGDPPCYDSWLPSGFYYKWLAEPSVPPDLGFRPNQHGYQFENFGGVKSWAMFERFFGTDAVRYPDGSKRSVAEDYFISKYREHWVGSCDGFAATSLLNFKRLDQPNAGDFAMPFYPNLYNEEMDINMGNAIFYQQGFLHSNVVDLLYLDQSYFTGNLPEKYYQIIRQMIHEGIILSIFRIGAGHSLVPYRIKESLLGNKAYVYVYDCNAPGDEERCITFDLNGDKWSYKMTNGETWEGEKGMRHLHMCVMPVSMRLGKGIPPWETRDNIVESTGPANLLFTDECGRRLGFVDDQFVSEIPGAIHVVQPMSGDRALDYYYLEGGIDSSVTILGTAEGDVCFDTYGDHSLIKLTTQVHSSTVDTIDSENSRSITYSTNDAHNDYSVTIDEELGDSGRIVSVDSSITQGDKATFELTDEQTFKYVNMGTQKSYDITLEQRGEGAGRISFAGLTTGSNDTHSTEITLEIDKDSDGTIDQTEIISNQKPDLVILEKWLCWPDNCTICYNVTNIGTGTAPAGHNTTLYVDGVEVAHAHVPVDLAPGESYTGCFNGYVWAYTPPSDNITVCADNNESIVELDEDNNCLTNIWICGDVNGDRAVNVIDVVLIYKRALDPGYPLDLPWAGDVNWKLMAGVWYKNRTNKISG